MKGHMAPRQQLSASYFTN